MTNENEFWLKVWGIVGTVLAVCVMSIAGCVAHRDAIKFDLVTKDGEDPIRVRCGFDMLGTAEMQLCATLVATKGGG